MITSGRRFPISYKETKRHSMNIGLDLRGLCAPGKRLLTAFSGGSLSKNKTVAEAWSLINDVAKVTQHVRVRNNPPKSVAKTSSFDLTLTKVLEEMTTLLKEIHQGKKASQSIQAIQAPPQILQLEGPPRVCGWRDNAQGNNHNQRWNQDNSSSQYHNQPSPQYHNNTYQANQNHHNQPYQHSQQNQTNHHRYQPPHQRQQTNQPPSSSTNQGDDSHCAFYQEQERLRAMIEKNKENTRNLNAQVGTMSVQMSSIAEILSRLSLPPINNTNTNQASSSSSLHSQPIPNPRGSINALP
ncbi:hypothetical protein AHAS_Ahas14G0096600 [Arachis hypogaea]